MDFHGAKSGHGTSGHRYLFLTSSNHIRLHYKFQESEVSLLGGPCTASGPSVNSLKLRSIYVSVSMPVRVGEFSARCRRSRVSRYR